LSPARPFHQDRTRTGPGQCRGERADDRRSGWRPVRNIRGDVRFIDPSLPPDTIS
jgi:hypothetical protein